MRKLLFKKPDIPTLFWITFGFLTLSFFLITVPLCIPIGKGAPDPSFPHERPGFLIVLFLCGVTSFFPSKWLCLFTYKATPEFFTETTNWFGIAPETVPEGIKLWLGSVVFTPTVFCIVSFWLPIFKSICVDLVAYIWLFAFFLLISMLFVLILKQYEKRMVLHEDIT